MSGGVSKSISDKQTKKELGKNIGTIAQLDHSCFARPTLAANAARVVHAVRSECRKLSMSGAVSKSISDKQTKNELRRNIRTITQLDHSWRNY